MSRAREKVVIVGGGFGGLEVAKGLAAAEVDVTLVDRSNYHLFQPLLYQVAMAGLSPGEIASPIRGILAEQANVRVLLGEVSEVDLDRRRVRVGDDELSYDRLVLAAGARTAYFGHDAWEAHAPGLKSVEDALEIRRRVLLAFERAERIADPETRAANLTFVVIGGGPTGVELAGAICELAHRVLSRDFRSVDPRDAKVHLIEAGPRILPTFSPALSASASEQLAELGVEVTVGARVTTIDRDGVVLESEGAKRRVDAQTVLWGAGVQANALTSRLRADGGVELDKQGRIVVAQDCSIPGHPEVFAIGDIARFEAGGKPLPGVSPVAIQQGRHVARILAAPREALRPEFVYVDKGSMATIGRSRAIAAVGSVELRGLLAWLAWLVIHIWYLIGFKNRASVLLDWMWSYVFYERGARLITKTGWRPTATDGAHAPPAAARAPGRAPLPERAPSPPA